MYHQSSLKEHTFLLFLSLLLVGANATDKAFPPFFGCEDSYANGIPDGDECYAVGSLVCRWQFDTGCKEQRATYYYYIGGLTTDFDYLRYHKIAVVASSDCNTTAEEPTQSCVVKVDNESGEGPVCNKCTNDPNDYKIVTLEDCSNLPGLFPSEPQTITVEAGEGYFELALNETRCSHPYFDNDDTAMPTVMGTSSNTLSPGQTPSPSFVTTPSPTEAPSISARPSSNWVPKTLPRLRAGAGQSTAKDMSQTTQTTTIAVHPKLKLFLQPATALPDAMTLFSLMEDTNGFFRALLHQHIPHLMGLSISELSTSDQLLEDSAMFFNFTTTLASSGPSLNARSVATLLSNNHNLHHYLLHVLTPIFPRVHMVRAWIVADGLEVAGEKML